MIESSSNYTINESTFGMSLQNFCFSRIPEINIPTLSLISKEKKVNDICPISKKLNPEQLHLLPYSDLDGVLKNGDIVIFLRPSLQEFWSNFDWKQLIKQRGWHAEIVYRDINGTFQTCAPWGGESKMKPHPIGSLDTHRHLKERLKDSCIHIIRPIPPGNSNPINFDRLLNQIPRWVSIFENFRFPKGDTWYLDPVDFEDYDSLTDIAKSLILKKDIGKVFCMQWVYTILCLSLNFPLTTNVIEKLGVREPYKKYWKDSLGIEKNEVDPLNRLPFPPYTSKEVVQAFIATNFPDYISEVSNILKSNKPLPLPIPKHGLPTRTVLPIIPFIEMFYKSSESNIDWEYVATGVAPIFLKKIT